MQNQYPLWKYIVLAVGLLLALVYALPNLYGENPAVQVAGLQTTVADSSTIQTIKKILADANISSQSIQQEQDNLILIRFKNTESQLKAREYIKAGLGNQYTVALNLAPSTPKWLRALNAEPMKLGLDLRGGVHFLLAVDVDSVIAKREMSEQNNMAAQLREKRIRYTHITRGANGNVTIDFRSETDLSNAYSALRSQFPDWDFIKKAENDRYQLNATIKPDALVGIQQSIVEQTMTVLRNRVNELGVTEPIVQQQGRDRIAVDLPGIQDAAQASKILGGTATLEFHLVDTKNDVRTALSGDIPEGSSIYYYRNGTPVLLNNATILKGSNITSATSAFGESGIPEVNITVSGSEVSYFHRVTAENVGKQMAIVFVETKNESKLVNGKLENVAKRVKEVISAPVIQSALGNSFRITGIQDSNEARDLALLLRAGALPANIYPVAETTVGPSLGQENIDKGILSIKIGFIAIVIFMLFYYRFFGFVADLALGANLILIVAILSLIGATLTLPGIAGILLTIGMAVDANVLINERIREELRKGMSPQAAIHAGYDRAFSTIVDANLTTLIVTVVLFILASGPVRGFAVTVTIGLLTSMLTSITGTRAVVNLIYGRRQRLKSLSIGIRNPL